MSAFQSSAWRRREKRFELKEGEETRARI